MNMAWEMLTSGHAAMTDMKLSTKSAGGLSPSAGCAAGKREA